MSNQMWYEYLRVYRVSARSAGYPDESRIVRDFNMEDALARAKAEWPAFRAPDASIWVEPA